ncbi:MAG TPA: nuclear transport factor 2 family protein [Burkholderiales bacterium]|nr:nuclear transport factor 2 family protein [Burkholderiales bacterium]
MTRKQIARTFLRLAATGKVSAAYERFVGRGFVHHNPFFPADADSLRKGMEAAAARFPRTTIETQRVLENGNLVAVHSRVRHQPKGADIAVVHLFRFRGARIVELWDIAMEVPKRSPNRAGAF